MDCRISFLTSLELLTLDDLLVRNCGLIEPNEVSEVLDFLAIQIYAVARLFSEELLREKDIHFVDQHYLLLFRFGNLLLLFYICLGVQQQGFNILVVN